MKLVIVCSKNNNHDIIVTSLYNEYIILCSYIKYIMIYGFSTEFSINEY